MKCSILYSPPPACVIADFQAAVLALNTAHAEGQHSADGRRDDLTLAYVLTVDEAIVRL